jgi:ribose-phosphate pyrophosphokinase
MSKYSDGEFQPSYEESIRGLRVYCLLHIPKQPDGIVTYDRCCKTRIQRHITANPYWLGKTRKRQAKSSDRGKTDS